MKKALLIGSNTYGLKYCNKDASLIDSCLKNYGFDTVCWNTNEQLENNQIDNELIDYLESLSECGGLFLFYFSGHASHSNGTLRLWRNENYYYNIKNIINTCDGYSSVKKIFILDCCYSGFINELGINTNEYFVLASGQSNNQSIELNSKQQSLMTLCFHKALIEIEQGEFSNIDLFNELIRQYTLLSDNEFPELNDKNYPKPIQASTNLTSSLIFGNTKVRDYKLAKEAENSNINDSIKYLKRALKTDANYHEAEVYLSDIYDKSIEDLIKKADELYSQSKDDAKYEAINCINDGIKLYLNEEYANLKKIINFLKKISADIETKNENKKVSKIIPANLIIDGDNDAKNQEKINVWKAKKCKEIYKPIPLEIFVSPKTTYYEALTLLIQYPICDFLITDNGKPDGKLFGILTRMDILKQLSEKNPQQFIEVSIDFNLEYEEKICFLDSPITKAIDVLKTAWKNPTDSSIYDYLKSVIVIDKNKILGYISYLDILREIKSVKDKRKNIILPYTTVEKYMDNETSLVKLHPCTQLSTVYREIDKNRKKEFQQDVFPIGTENKSKFKFEGVIYQEDFYLIMQKHVEIINDNHDLTIANTKNLPPFVVTQESLKKIATTTKIEDVINNFFEKPYYKSFPIYKNSTLYGSLSYLNILNKIDY